MAPPEALAVTLVSRDLMFASRLRLAVERTGRRLVTQGSSTDLPACDWVFIDLNQDSGHRLGLVARLREARPTATIIGFCHHGERELRVAAMAAGASQVVTNGALQEVALRLAGVTPGSVATEAAGDG